MTLKPDVLTLKPVGFFQVRRSHRNPAQDRIFSSHVPHEFMNPFPSAENSGPFSSIRGSRVRVGGWLVAIDLSLWLELMSVLVYVDS